MLHNLSITDRSDYLLKKNVTKLKRLSTKTKHKEEQEFILPSELENQDKDKIIVNKINSKINPAASIMLEENSAYDFDDLPNHKNVHSNSNSSVASCRKRLSTTQSIKFLSRKDLLHYTKNIPVKVDTTISTELTIQLTPNLVTFLDNFDQRWRSLVMQDVSKK